MQRVRITRIFTPRRLDHQSRKNPGVAATQAPGHQGDALFAFRI